MVMCKIILRQMFTTEQKISNKKKNFIFVIIKYQNSLQKSEAL